MAIFMGNKVAVIVGTTTISDHVSTVSLAREIDQVEITAMSDNVQNMIGGVERPTLSLEVYNDFAAASVNSLFEDALGTKLNIKLIPVAGTVSATNPSYTMSCLVSSWTPINGAIDSVASVSVSLPVTALTKSTSA
ncbi:hypothetical protein UFOVP701_28 [uncultured Caudovirales phage]|jgi:hypothetical protein|uniref:Uncharacterized protein n=1 Tax=uncultured Caudovirales phage TaxID=2100421 RepID=A0A6J5NNT0_9CAUD|nr:hypothetical protein UFOVP701_28 [uncultured Caudovirales phage]